MLVVETTQEILTKATNDSPLSPTTKRVPLRALQMLTQSVSPLTRDYVQPFPISDVSEQQKKSPLALLAATCSSIGKTESKLETREAALSARQSSPKISSSLSSNNTTISDGRSSISKLSNDESKSSFKPYKHDEKEPNHNSSIIEKPGFRAPSKDTSDSLSHSTHSKSPEFRSKAHVGSFTPFQYPYLADSTNAHCYYQSQNRMCGMYFDMAHVPSAGHHSTCLKSDCPGNCGSMLLPPTSLATPTTPTVPSIRPIFPTPPVSAPSTVKSHSLPGSRTNPLYPRCNCGYCNQAAPSQDGSLKGIQHPGLPHYHRDYIQATTNCQDPYCTNCKSQILSPSSATTGTSPRGCGPHCFHQHHDNTTVLPGSLSSITPTMSHLYPYGFMLRSQTDQTNPFVCNWVQDSKNCGKNFTTSDDLLQHLRTHTSAANAAAPLHTPCNIPGCPCNLKSALVTGPSRLHSTRYHPYFIPNPSALHTPSFHSAITPYASPHGLPYAPPFKPY